MALPFSRNTTYAIGSQVKSADLNALQDSIVNHHNNRTIHIPAIASLIVSGAAPNISYGGAVKQVAAGGAITGLIDLSPYLIVGATIKEITFRWRNGVTPAVGAFDAALRRNDIGTDPYDTGTSVAAITSQDTSTGGASAMRSTLLSVAHVVLADNVYLISWDLDATAGNDQASFGGLSLVLGA